MAKNEEEKAPDHRVAQLISLLALAVSGTAAFARVFQGKPASLKLMAAAAAAVLIASALEWRHVFLGALASAAGLALAVGLLIFPSTTQFGLPTLSTFHATMQAMGQVGHQAAVQVAPALSLPPLMLAALIAVWTASFSAHTLAARTRSPFLAILPPCALMAFSSVVVGDGVRPVYVLPFLLSALAVAFTDALRRVGQWGPVTTWHARRGWLSFGSVTTVRGARRVALACVGIAAFAPLLIPGFRSEGILHLNGDQGAQRVSINPIVDLRPSLLQNPSVELFTVSSPQPSYWRFLTLDTYTGRVWTSPNLDASGGQTLQTGVLQSTPPVDSDVLATVGLTLQQHFTFDHLAQPWLPAAPDPTEILVSAGSVRYDPRSAALVAPNGTYPQFQYDVVSQVIVPTPRELDQVTFPGGPETARNTRLPADTPAQIAAIARRWTAGQPTIYRKILAIQDNLRSFTYDESVQPGHTTSDILNFLTNLRRGYCEQFAGSMAVLLRALGIPARVAVGFTPGRFDARAHLFHVSTLQAHAWVEVLFPRYGWLPFEPTPTRTNPVADTYTAPSPAAINFCLTPERGCASNQQTVATPNRTNGSSFDRRTSGIDELNARKSPHRGPGLAATPRPHSRRGMALKALLALVVLLAAGIPGAKFVRRRLAVSRAHGARERVLAAYFVLARDATDLGVGPRPSETLREYAERLRRRVAFSNGDLERLTSFADQAAYSAAQPTPINAEQARAAARAVMADLRRATPLSRRMIGWFRIERFSSSR